MDSILYTARLEVLSPLHIGTGTWLMEGLDWTRDGAWMYVAHQDRIFETVLERATAAGQDEADVIEAITGLSLDDLRRAGWLVKEDFGEGSPLFRYRLRGEPAMKQIAEAIKDVYGQPYVPGSSLKGALRTIIAIAGATVTKADLSRTGEKRSWAAQPIERELFGKNPNYDLLRALQVSDSQPVDATHLDLVRVNVFPTAQQTEYGRSKGLDLDVEALRKGTALTATIKIDGTLFGDDRDLGRQVREELGFGRQRKWLTNLARAARSIAGKRIADEHEFLGNKRDGGAAASFYGHLSDTWQTLGENELLLQMGWGTGWHTKTFGRLLQADPETFEKLVQRYRLSPQDPKRGAGQPFPKSRKLVRRGDRAAEPMGWVKVSLEPR